MKIGRNQLCPCGSGKKYKRCCLGKEEVPAPRVNIVTFLTHEEIFNGEDGSLEANLQSLPANETIVSTAYVNMVMQTSGFQTAQKMQLADARRYFTDRRVLSSLDDNSKILFTRDTLLSLISKLVSTNSSYEHALDEEHQKRVIESLLLTNSEINSTSGTNTFELERMLIRNPPFMQSKELEWFYKHNFLRYRKIYSEYPSLLDSHKQQQWQQIEAEFKTQSGISLSEYMKTFKELFVWYLISRNYPAISAPGFKPENPETFFILRSNFASHPEIISSLELISKDIAGLSAAFQISKPFTIDNENYKYYPYIFDNPVYKLSDDKFCILDLTYLMENACGGLMFKLFDLNRTQLHDNMQDFKGIYGELLDKYFGWLINEMFATNAVVTTGNTGKQDALLQVTQGGKEYFIVIEFCTKNYRFQSLYNSDLASWLEDVDNIFFNEARDGKFAKLNRYIEALKAGHPNAEFIPMLITEKYIGDYDLINRHDAILDKGIAANGLTNLQNFKPVILELLDLESFWAGSVEGQEASAFLTEIQGWESSPKGQRLFRFMNFTGDPTNNKTMDNEKYLSAFNINKLFHP